MVLVQVDITTEAFQACTIHALSSESEEIMGLLLGSYQGTRSGQPVARVWAVLPQIRADRRKDRVEASPEQLAKSSAAAEQLTEETGVHTQVVGWYHSHPHITVHPSHVDVRTQAIYQMMDERFVGLIWSVFNADAQGGQSMQVTAFQSVPADSQPPTPHSVPASDSPLARALSLSRKDARAAALSEVPMIRADIPLAVVRPRCRAETERVRDLGVLLRMLVQEEQQELAAAVEEARDGKGEVPVLTAMHHAGVYQQRMARLMDTVICPVLLMLRNLQQQRNLQYQQREAAERVQPSVAIHQGSSQSVQQDSRQGPLSSLDAWAHPESQHHGSVQGPANAAAEVPIVPASVPQIVKLSYIGYGPTSHSEPAQAGQQQHAPSMPDSGSQPASYQAQAQDLQQHWPPPSDWQSFAEHDNSHCSPQTTARAGATSPAPSPQQYDLPAQWPGLHMPQQQQQTADYMTQHYHHDARHQQARQLSQESRPQPRTDRNPSYQQQPDCTEAAAGVQPDAGAYDMHTVLYPWHDSQQASDSQAESSTSGPEPGATAGFQPTWDQKASTDTPEQQQQQQQQHSTHEADVSGLKGLPEHLRVGLQFPSGTADAVNRHSEIEQARGQANVHADPFAGLLSPSFRSSRPPPRM